MATATKRVPFKEYLVKAYLDGRIKYWRQSRKKRARYYIDAYQSVRNSLFGETLPLEERESGPLCVNFPTVKI